MRSYLFAAASCVSAMAGLFVAIAPAHAERGLNVGTCVVADKLHPGTIVAVLPNGYSVKGPAPSDTPLLWPFDDVVTAACPANTSDGVAPPERQFVQRPLPTPSTPVPAALGTCFANDTVRETGLDGRIRAVLIRGFAHQPNPGEDGRITAHINSLRVGASRPASPVDAVQFQTVAGRTMYDARVSFDTCTDYNRRSVFVRRERNFVCFTKASGVFDCSMTANSPGLAEDQKREVPK